MKNIVKLFSVILIVMTMFSFSTVFGADVNVQINGEIVDFTDSNGNKVNAQIINSRTMVPLRKIFEILGCEIEWNGATRTVNAKKGSKEIILQINNNVATKIENGIREKILLDTAPTIVNDRTMVPLRFIAESLDKQVGWDNSARTAIIIDYDYFANLIKQKNIDMYNVLESQNLKALTVTREYIDKEKSSNNDTAILKANIVKIGETSNVTLNFEGNNEMIKDIISEGWNNIVYDAKYEDDKMFVRIQNETVNKMLNFNTDSYNECLLKELDLEGSFTQDLSGWIKSIFNVDESRVFVSTFGKLKKDFNTFVDLFVVNGTRNINYTNARLQTFDYMKFDSLVYENEASRVLSFINKKIFNYDFEQDDMFYDWPVIKYSMNTENNKITLKITMENEYNEIVNYIVTCESN